MAHHSAARKDPKEIWDESEVVDVVEDDIDDGRTIPECVHTSVLYWLALETGPGNAKA